MKFIISILLSVSMLVAATPTFNSMYTVTCEMYYYNMQPENYRGETRLYIGEGFDSSTGQYLDFFAGDSGRYPFEIDVTILELEMSDSTYLDYSLSGRDSLPYIYTDVRNGERRVWSAIYDSVVLEGEIKCSYFSGIHENLDSIPSVGDHLEFMESTGEECVHLEPKLRRNFFVITSITQTQEPTGTILSVSRKVHVTNAPVRVVDLMGRKFQALSPGISVSPHTPALRIGRGQ